MGLFALNSGSVSGAIAAMVDDEQLIMCLVKYDETGKRLFTFEKETVTILQQGARAHVFKCVSKLDSPKPKRRAVCVQRWYSDACQCQRDQRMMKREY